MFNATVTFLIPFFGLSISSGIQRKLIEGVENESKEYIFNSLLLFAIASAAFSILLSVFSGIICRYTAIPISLFPHILVFTASTCLCDVILCYFQTKEKTHSYAIFQNCCTALNVGLSIMFVVGFGMGLKGRVYGISFSKLFFALIAFALIYKYLKGNHSKINKSFIKDEIFNFALPLIPIGIKSTVLTYTDRIFLTNMINVAATGVYSFGNQISLPILFFEQSFNLAFIPWLYKRLKENKESEKKKIVKITYIYFVAAPIIAIFWSVLAKPLIAVIGSPAYKDAHIYVFWLSLGYAFTGMYMMVVNYVYYVKKLNIYAFITIIIMACNIILNIILIEKHGSVGAAEATMICNFISFAFTWILSIKICPMPWFFFWKQKKRNI